MLNGGMRRFRRWSGVRACREKWRGKGERGWRGWFRTLEGSLGGGLSGAGGGWRGHVGRAGRLASSCELGLTAE